MEGLTFQQLLAELERAGAQRPRQPSWLPRVLELLRASFRDPPALAELAREAGVDPAHLARAFRAQRRCTVGEHVRRLRVEHCCRALASTARPLAEIALDAGFADQAHFSRVFRRHMGITPSAYRRTRAQ